MTWLDGVEPSDRATAVDPATCELCDVVHELRSFAQVDACRHNGLIESGPAADQGDAAAASGPIADDTGAGAELDETAAVEHESTTDARMGGIRRDGIATGQDHASQLDAVERRVSGWTLERSKRQDAALGASGAIEQGAAAWAIRCSRGFCRQTARIASLDPQRALRHGWLPDQAVGYRIVAGVETNRVVSRNARQCIERSLERGVGASGTGADAEVERSGWGGGGGEYDQQQIAGN